MTVEVVQERPDLIVFTFRGVMKKREFEAIQDDNAERMSQDAPLNLLCIFEDFQGWDKGDWADPKIHEFAYKHDEDVARIAIVCAQEAWKDPLLTFAGGPYTSREVRWFGADADEARAWLST